MRRARDSSRGVPLEEPPFPYGKRFSRTSLGLILRHLQGLLPYNCHSVDQSRPIEIKCRAKSMFLLFDFYQMRNFDSAATSGGKGHNFFMEPRIHPKLFYSLSRHHQP